LTTRGLALTALAALGLLSRAEGQSASGTPVLPIVGLAQVTFKVSDLGKARAYYDGVLGLPEAFTLRDESGKTSSVYFKVNDGQFIEVVPTLEPGTLKRQERVAFESSDVERLRAIYVSRGLNPSAVTKGPDGNPVFRVADPEGNRLDFLQYVAGSQQMRIRGNFLEARRLTTHLLHAGIMIRDRPAATAFYQDGLGFDGARTIPGGRGEYLELPSTDRNLETKDPPLDPNDAATKARYTREVYGAVYHVGLDVPDIRAVRDQLQQRGHYDDARVRATVGNNRHWLIHVFDPDGSRSEFMEAALQDLPAGTVMPAGPPARPVPPVPVPQTSAPSTTAAGTSSRYVDAVPADAGEHTGWREMFDGVSLRGWDGPMDLWHVDNGVITVHAKADPPTGPTYLIWQGGEPKDFEFRFDVKLEGAGANSGTQFRATLLGEVPGNRMSKWETRGYQADIDNAGANTGALIECCAGPRRGVPPRPDRAFRGQVVRTSVSPGAKPTLLSTFDDPEALKNVWKVGDWNQMYVVARGRTMLFWINGRLMSVLIDDHPTMFVDHGVLAIQLEGRGENTASFRNLWIKMLP
jgi:catechol 2,3-dioxygenase-like lactoylglutathione lyase family enzyme